MFWWRDIFDGLSFGTYVVFQQNQKLTFHVSSSKQVAPSPDHQPTHGRIASPPAPPPDTSTPPALPPPPTAARVAISTKACTSSAKRRRGSATAARNRRRSESSRNCAPPRCPRFMTWRQAPAMSIRNGLAYARHATRCACHLSTIDSAEKPLRGFFCRGKGGAG